MPAIFLIDGLFISVLNVDVIAYDFIDNRFSVVLQSLQCSHKFINEYCL